VNQRDLQRDFKTTRCVWSLERHCRNNRQSSYRRDSPSSHEHQTLSEQAQLSKIIDTWINFDPFLSQSPGKRGCGTSGMGCAIRQLRLISKHEVRDGTATHVKHSLHFRSGHDVSETLSLVLHRDSSTGREGGAPLNSGVGLGFRSGTTRLERRVAEAMVETRVHHSLLVRTYGRPSRAGGGCRSLCGCLLTRLIIAEGTRLIVVARAERIGRHTRPEVDLARLCLECVSIRFASCSDRAYAVTVME